MFIFQLQNDLHDAEEWLNIRLKQVEDLKPSSASHENERNLSLLSKIEGEIAAFKPKVSTLKLNATKVIDVRVKPNDKVGGIHSTNLICCCVRQILRSSESSYSRKFRLCLPHSL